MVAKKLLSVGAILLLVLCAGCIGSPGPDKKNKDTDKDGYIDQVDAFPNDPTEWNDTDHDGVGDHKDDFPTESRYSAALKVSSSDSYWAELNYTVFGFIQNNKTRSVGSHDKEFLIKVTLYHNGNYFKELSDFAYQHIMMELAPGETVPFTYSVPDTQHLANSFKVEVAANYENLTPLNYVLVKNVTGSYDGGQKIYNVAADFYDPGPQGAYGLHIVFAFYSGGTLVDMRIGNGTYQDLGVGETKHISSYSPAPTASSIGSTKVWLYYDNS